MFGAKTAVVNYDIVSNTLYSQISGTIPKDLVHSQVDDVPTIGRKNSSWCKEFTIEYEKVCKDLDIELAPECPLREKAFKNVSSGKVLGIIFNSEDLSWRLPEDKRIDYMNLVHKTLSDNTLSQISRDFSRYRRECNCQKAIYIGTVRDWGSDICIETTANRSRNIS